MKSIEFLIDEHKEIKVFLDRLEDECVSILNTKEIDQEFFKAAISFIREFADGIHHKKEEDILFKYMTDNLGNLADKVITHGMLVEHNLARGHVFDLEKAIDLYNNDKSDINLVRILGHTTGYINLLRKHIEKEDNTVYTFAEKNLADDLKTEIEELTDKKIKEEANFSKRKKELMDIIFN